MEDARRPEKLGSERGDYCCRGLESLDVPVHAIVDQKFYPIVFFD